MTQLESPPPESSSQSDLAPRPVAPPPQIGDLANPFARLQPNSPVTYILVGLIVLIFFFTASQGALDNSSVLIQYGSTYGPFMIDDGQLWRLFSSMFLHASNGHILFNSLALYSLGREIERIYGSGRFLILYLLSGLAGSLLSFAIRGYAEFSVGASGAIFGIAGVNLAFYYFYRERLGKFGQDQFQSMLRLVGINLLIGFVYISINNWAHIGGLIGGAILGYMMLPYYTVTETLPTVEIEDRNGFAQRWWVLTLTFMLFVAIAFVIRGFYS